MECIYNLMTYGIPRNAIPINNEGGIELEFLHSFLEAITRKEADDETRLRQERLDRQIKQLQLQNQMSYNNTIGTARVEQGIPDRKVEPYQREAPILSEEGDNEAERFSWNNSGVSGIDSLDFDVQDDFLKRLSECGNSAMNSTNSKLETTSSAIQPEQKPLQPNTIQIPTSVAASVVKPDDNPQSSFALGSSLSPQSDRKKDEFIVVPNVLDVIMGRGRHNKKKPGNRKLNQMLETYQDEYEASDKFQKTVLSEVVVSKMIGDGSRFLVREGEKKHGMWVEVSLEKARDKVAHDFRNLRRNAKIAKQNATDSFGPNDFVAPKRQRSQVNVKKGQNDSKMRKHSGIVT
jgi:hypothetical protein